MKAQPVGGFAHREKIRSRESVHFSFFIFFGSSSGLTVSLGLGSE
jgi:hypothetical protein